MEVTSISSKAARSVGKINKKARQSAGVWKSIVMEGQAMPCNNTQKHTGREREGEKRVGV